MLQSGRPTAMQFRMIQMDVSKECDGKNKVHINTQPQRKIKKNTAANHTLLKLNFCYFNNVLLKEVVKLVIKAAQLLHFHFVRFDT